MSAATCVRSPSSPLGAPSAGVVRVALFGCGQVAQALAGHVDRLHRSVHAPRLQLAAIANTRGRHRLSDGDWRGALGQAVAWPRGGQSTDPCPELGDDIDLVIDATASEAVAHCHAAWLRRGVAVVTANKRGLGECAGRAAQIDAARMAGAIYGDSATVGAGLGAIARLRQFRSLGEPVDEIAGVLSGTLAWLFDRYDGRCAFSGLVREAHALGYTEPDPREDVGAVDVARKLRILARAARSRGSEDPVAVDSRLACGTGQDAWKDIERLDARLAALYREQPDPTSRLAVIARADGNGLRVGLEWLPAHDPLAARQGCDNLIVIRSERYRERPLLLRGPGAGPALTAAALLDDVLAAARLPHVLRGVGVEAAA